MTKLTRIAFCASLIGSLLCCGVSYADNIENDSGFWTTTSVSLGLKKNWRAGFTVQTRAQDDFERLERTVLRPSLSYRFLKDTWFTAGYDAHFMRLPRDRIEQRAWQQVQSIWRFTGASFSTRVRLEERFIENLDETAFRLRARLRLDVPIENTDWKVSVSNEYFSNFNDVRRGPRAGFDQNRAYVGLSGPLADKISASVGYQAQYIDRFGRSELLVHQAMLGLSVKTN